MTLDLPALPADAPRRLVLGFSGGRDSTVLLHRLAALREARGWTLRAVHVDHGLHPASSAWADAAVRVCAGLGVPCEVRRVEVRPDGRGPEDAARRARMAALASACGGDETLVLAHHRDDQVETVLLALLRGADRGLGGMRAWTRDARGSVWRPLLGLAGDAICAYARTHGLRWIEDPSNDDRRFDRNALRHDLMPTLRERFPGAAAAIAALAERQAARLEAADVQAGMDLATLLDATGTTLDAAALRTLPPARADHALRHWARERGGRITDDAIRRVLGPWAAMPPGRALRHAQGGHWLRQWDGRLWWTPRHPAPPRWPEAAWDGAAPLDLGGAGRLRLVGADRFEAPLAVRPRAAAPARLVPAGGAARPVARLLSGWRIPPWQRDAIPLLVGPGDRLAAIADLAYGAGLDAWLRARGARVVWQPDPGLG